MQLEQVEADHRLCIVRTLDLDVGDLPVALHPLFLVSSQLFDPDVQGAVERLFHPEAELLGTGTGRGVVGDELAQAHRLLGLGVDDGHRAGHRFPGGGG